MLASAVSRCAAHLSLLLCSLPPEHAWQAWLCLLSRGESPLGALFDLNCFLRGLIPKCHQDTAEHGLGTQLAIRDEDRLSEGDCCSDEGHCAAPAALELLGSRDPTSAPHAAGSATTLGEKDNPVKAKNQCLSLKTARFCPPLESSCWSQVLAQTRP